MINGASMCEVGAVYVGTTSTLMNGMTDWQNSFIRKLQLNRTLFDHGLLWSQISKVIKWVSRVRFCSFTCGPVVVNVDVNTYTWPSHKMLPGVFTLAFDKLVWKKKSCFSPTVLLRTTDYYTSQEITSTALPSCTASNPTLSLFVLFRF